jgi:hypothetical protein
VLVDDRAIALEILIHNNAGLKAAEQPCQRALAFFNPCATQVFTVQLEHIEGAQLGADVMPMPADQVENRQPLVVGDNRFAVDYARMHRQGPHCLDDLREAAAKIVAVTAHQADGLGLAVAQDAQAVVLYLVNPASARRRPISQSRQARIKWRRGPIGAYPAPELTHYIRHQRFK